MSLSKQDKERTKLIQEKCQSMLNEMLRDEDNKYCVDCDAKGPRWASWNLGIFLCIRCAGIHRNLGVHISKVKSVNLDTWTPEQVVSMTTMGNSRGRAVYEANLPDNFRRPQTDVSLENFIRAKYEHNKYIAKEWVKPGPVVVDWKDEIDELIKSKKKNPTSQSSIIPPPGSAFATKRVVGQSKDPKPVTAPAPIVAPTPTAAQLELAPAPLQTTLDLLGGLVLDSSPNPVETQKSNLDELGSVEFNAGSNVPTGQKLTTESILSLYSNQSTNNNPFNNFQQSPNLEAFQIPQQLQQPQQNIFINPLPQQQQNNFWK